MNMLNIPCSIEEHQKEKLIMRSTLIASIPALVVLFGLAFGFATFHLIAEDAKATGAECNYLESNCRQENKKHKDCMQQ